MSCPELDQTLLLLHHALSGDNGFRACNGQIRLRIVLDSLADGDPEREEEQSGNDGDQEAGGDDSPFPAPAGRRRHWR
jgi:hypothetical protein